MTQRRLGNMLLVGSAVLAGGVTLWHAYFTPRDPSGFVPHTRVVLHLLNLALVVGVIGFAVRLRTRGVRTRWVDRVHLMACLGALVLAAMQGWRARHWLNVMESEQARNKELETRLRVHHP